MRELSPIFKAAVFSVATLCCAIFSNDAAGKNEHAPQFLGPTPPNNDTLVVPVGQNLAFQVLGKDVDVKQPNGNKPTPGDTVTLTSTLLPGLSTMTPALPFKAHMSGGGSTIGSNFAWTPLIADTGLHSVTYTLTDNSAGLLNASRTIYIFVMDTTNTPNPNNCLLDLSAVVTPVICDSGMIDLTILNSVDTPFTIMWSTGDTLEDVFNLPVGTYWVTVTDTNNCVATDTFVIDTLDPTILVSPASIINNGVATIYKGYGPQSATLSIPLDSNSGYVINWFADTVLIDSTSPVIIVSPDTTTTYVVTITDTLNNCFVSDTLTINVDTSASCGSHKVKICHKGKTICIDTNAVSAHLAHGCTIGECDSTAPKMSPGFADGMLEVYPNPSNGEAIVAVPEEASTEAQLIVTDLNGKIIVNKKTAGAQFLDLHLENVPKGLYMIQVIDGKEVYRSKLYIQQQ